MDWSDRYPYTPENVRRLVPNQPGNYRLIYAARDGNFYPFYVGQSTDLEGRLLDHLQPSEPNGCIRRHVRSSQCFFRYVVVRSQWDRDRIEREEIQNFNPECNRT